MADRTTLVLVVAGIAGVGGAFWLGRSLTRPEPAAIEFDAGPRVDGSSLPPVGTVDENPFPARWEDVEPHVIPIVRSRLGNDVGRLVVDKGPLDKLEPLPPHHDLGAGMWGQLAYETKKQFIRIPAGQWAAWKVDFAVAWTSATERLAKRTTQPLKRGGRALRESQFGDDNDTARIVLPVVFDTIDLPKAIIALPRRSLLLVADPKDETALDELAERLFTEATTGDADLHVYEWTAGKLAPFMPPKESRLHAKFLDLARSAHQADVKVQTEALKKRLGDGEDAPFVASLFRVKHPTTQDEFTYVVSTEGVTTLLPRAEYVCFIRVDLATNSGTPRACASWDRVLSTMKDRWKESSPPLHPPRWFVTDFPSDAELKAFGFEKSLGR